MLDLSEDDPAYGQAAPLPRADRLVRAEDGATRRLFTDAGASPEATLAPGSVLGGRWTVHAVLATGSMGAVYRVIDRDGRAYALKELLHGWTTPEERAEAEAWFAREGEILLALRHPAIPRVFSAFGQGARSYLVMDLVEGQTLEEALATYGRPGLPEDAVLFWADQILDVLGYLHARPDPLIFRDLKPANVMRTADEQIRLVDFGIARVFAGRMHGTAIGTPGYAPPEQYQGLAEPSSDLYALGATLHHLLSGCDPRRRRPFDFPPLAGLAPWVSAPVAAAVDRVLALEPRVRHSSAAELRSALHMPAAPVPAAVRFDAPQLAPAAARPEEGSAPPVRAASPAWATRITPHPPSGGPVPRSSAHAGGAAAAAMEMPLGRAALQLRPRQLRVITLKRSLPGPDLEVRSVRVRNTTGEWLYCRFAGTLPWVHPDRQVGWIEPHGVLEMAVRVARPDPARRGLRGGLEIRSGDQRWQLPVHQHQRGASWPLLVLWQGAGAVVLAALIAAVWTVILVVSMSHGALPALLVCLAALLAVCARTYRVRRF